MNSHLVSIKVSIVARTYTRMQLDSRTFNQNREECLDTEFVQCWCTIEQYRMVLGNFFKDVKNFRWSFFDIPFCGFNICCQTSDDNFTKNEWFEHLKS